MQYRVLGPLEVADGDRIVQLSQSKERTLLAVLLINANTVVSADRLLEDVWGADQPASGLKALRYHISKLRDALYPERTSTSEIALRTQAPGYVLDLGPDDLDATLFRRLVDDGRASLDSDPGAAEQVLQQAIDLWRGAAWTDFRFDDFTQPAIQGIEELRLEAHELLMRSGLDLGRHQELLPKLTALVAEHPLREGFRAQLMTSLYRCGRQAEALQTYRELRDQLGEQLGLEPSPELAALEEQVLLQDRALHGGASLVVDPDDGQGTALPDS